jgi:hypothetical protein
MLLQRNFLLVFPLRLLKIISQSRLALASCGPDLPGASGISLRSRLLGELPLGLKIFGSSLSFGLISFYTKPPSRVVGGVARGAPVLSHTKHLQLPFASRVKDRILDCRYGTLPLSRILVSHAPLLLQLYLSMQPEPVNTARSPSFWPGPSPARPEGHWARAGTARCCRPCLGCTSGPRAGPARPAK